MDRKIVAEMIACDDWATAISIATPLIERYGPTVLNWIKERFTTKDSVTPYGGPMKAFK
jgi:hypothetical protein